jgi:GT2 family glycosyltransferase
VQTSANDSVGGPLEVSLTAVVVNYNAGPLLVDCVRRALAQCEEVVVVDNASADNSIALLGQAFAGNTNLLVVRNPTNLGFAGGCNIGTAHAMSTHVLFLNPDCLLDPRAVARLLDAIESDPAVGMVGGVLVNPDGTEQGGGRRAVPTPWRSLVRAMGLSRFAERWPKLFFDFHLHKQPLPSGPIEVEAISGVCMLVRQSTLAEVGRWDDGYFLHCEDLDLCMRLTRAGRKILFVPNARIVHYKGVCSRGRPIFVEWHKHRGMMLFYRKFFRHQYPGVLMWLVALGVWSRFAAPALFFSGRRLRKFLARMHGCPIRGPAWGNMPPTDAVCSRSPWQSLFRRARVGARTAARRVVRPSTALRLAGALPVGPAP